MLFRKVVQTLMDVVQKSCSKSTFVVQIKNVDQKKLFKNSKMLFKKLFRKLFKKVVQTK